MASRRKGPPEPQATSYTADPRQATMEGLPTQLPQVVPDEVRYQELLAKYGRKPKRAPPGQLVIDGIGLAGASPDAAKLGDPRAQMGLFGGAAPAAPARRSAAEPPPSSDATGPPPSKGRGG
jgi:hypothetical protein